jgi:hypothetical protein
VSIGGPPCANDDDAKLRHSSGSANDRPQVGKVEALRKDLSCIGLMESLVRPGFR